MKLRRTVGILTHGLLFALAIEFGARIDDAVTAGADFWAPYSINTLFEPSEHGRRGKAGARYGKWEINRDGYRGPETRQGATGVVIFGASETFGLYESAGNEYPRRLERHLDQTASGRFNVANLALPGTRIGRWGYLVRGIEKTNAKVAVIYPSPANYIGITQSICQATSAPVPVRFGLTEQIRAVGKLEQLFKKHAPLPLMTTLRQFSIWRETRGTSVMDRVPEATISAFREDLACATQAAQRAGAAVVLVTHANYFGNRLRDEDMPMMTAWRRFYPELKETGFMDLEARANRAIAEVAKQSGAGLVDANAAIPPGADYFADFVHFTDKGAEAMARLLTHAVASAVGNSP